MVFWEQSYRGGIENLRRFIYKVLVRSLERYLAAYSEQSAVSFQPDQTICTRLEVQKDILITVASSIRFEKAKIILKFTFISILQHWIETL